MEIIFTILGVPIVILSAVILITTLANASRGKL